MDYKYKVTIFTPTYNRAYTIERLYKSLLSQSCMDFEWLIVDDGSNDETENLVQEFISDKKISVSYFKKQNGGKHTAINKGLDLAQGEWFFIVDSDDYLPTDSIENILQELKNIEEDKRIVGIVGLMQDEKRNVIGTGLKGNDGLLSTVIESRNKYKIQGDLAKIVRTDISKKFKFPIIPNERFVAESIIWNRMAAEDYLFRFFNKVIYIAEYQKNGLSANSIRNRRKYPKYATLLYSELVINPKNTFLYRIRASINYWRFAFCTKDFYMSYKESGDKFLSLFTVFLGALYYMKDTIQLYIKGSRNNL
jgi:glycosyltransferase involved in cell wall biosynthesis